MTNDNAMTHSPLVAEPNSPTPVARPRPFYWSVQRELWENRSIYIAPLIAAGVVLLGFVITAFRLPHLRRNALALEPTRMRAAIEMPYDMAALMIMFVAFIVGIFYTLDALHGERRDRSILFWKSMPVSDLTAVLAKAFIPLVVMNVLTFVIVVATHSVMLLTSTAALLPSGLAGTTWTHLPYGRLWVMLAYALVTTTLWQAPFYAWLLLVSGWARRATFLWAVLPWLAICAIEKLVFDTGAFARMLVGRVTGNIEGAFVVVHHGRETHVPIVDRLTQLDPLRFFSTPGLWIGLVVAAAFFFAAVRLRRYRGAL